MSIKIKIDGLDKFQRIIEQNARADLDSLQAVISNNSDHILPLEYGSVVGEKPWQSAGEKTEITTDAFDGGTKVVSTQGYAMLRGNEEAAKKQLEKNMSNVRLDKPIRPQVAKAINNAAALWFRNAIIETPIDQGDARAAWKLDKAD